MNEKITSTGLGSVIGFVGGLTTDKIIEVIILSFIGGLMGAFGHFAFKLIKNYYKKRQK